MTTRRPYRLSDFDFDLPSELIAQIPAPQRSASRLLHLDGARYTDLLFGDLPELLAPGGSVVSSFPRWTWTKGPVRKLRYEVINNCPIFDYTRDGLTELFAGYSAIDVRPGKSGFLLRAKK